MSGLITGGRADQLSCKRNSTADRRAKCGLPPAFSETGVTGIRTRAAAGPCSNILFECVIEHFYYSIITISTSCFERCSNTPDFFRLKVSLSFGAKRRRFAIAIPTRRRNTRIWRALAASETEKHTLRESQSKRKTEHLGEGSIEATTNRRTSSSQTTTPTPKRTKAKTFAAVRRVTRCALLDDGRERPTTFSSPRLPILLAQPRAQPLRTALWRGPEGGGRAPDLGPRAAGSSGPRTLRPQEPAEK